MTSVPAFKNDLNNNPDRYEKISSSLALPVCIQLGASQLITDLSVTAANFRLLEPIVPLRSHRQAKAMLCYKTLPHRFGVLTVVAENIKLYMFPKTPTLQAWPAISELLVRTPKCRQLAAAQHDSTSSTPLISQIMRYKDRPFFSSLPLHLLMHVGRQLYRCHGRTHSHDARTFQTHGREQSHSFSHSSPVLLGEQKDRDVTAKKRLYRRYTL